jgi:hypothetical protein
MRPDFAELEAEALAAPFSGWDFSWLDRRSVNEPLPWSYRQEAARYSGSAAAMLDMGTGGGEVLSRLLDLEIPAQPDSWLPLAQRQLGDAGLEVVTAVAGEERHHLSDVAAVIYYLRVVSWAIPEYSLARYRERLRSAWAAADRWPVTIRPRRFLLVSRR